MPFEDQEFTPFEERENKERKKGKRNTMKEKLEYKVIYNDGGRTRVKDLIFIKKLGPLLMFENELNKREEIIHQNCIVRMESK